MTSHFWRDGSMEKQAISVRSLFCITMFLIWNPGRCGDGSSGLKTRTLFCSHMSQLCSLGNHGGVWSTRELCSFLCCRLVEQRLVYIYFPRLAGRIDFISINPQSSELSTSIRSLFCVCLAASCASLEWQPCLNFSLPFLLESLCTPPSHKLCLRRRPSLSGTPSCPLTSHVPWAP